MAPSRTPLGELWDRLPNLGALYPLGGCFMGAFIGTLLLAALFQLPGLRPWLNAAAFTFRGGGEIDNAGSLILLGAMAGITWGMAWWFIKDRRDALAASAPRRQG